MSSFRRLLFVGCLAYLCLRSVSVHGQTTGQIAGIVRDQTGSVIVGAEVTILRKATGDRRTLTTDQVGRYVAPLLTPDTYDVVIAAPRFQTATFPGIHVDVTETTTIDAQLIPASVVESVTVSGVAPVIRTGGPQLGHVIDSHFLSALPLATRNVTQVLALSPGAATYLPDNTGVGRNTQAISVNGARVTQNNFEIDGVDVNTMGTSGAITLPVPAPEAIDEFKVQTSLFDASFGRSGGANIQVVTRSGTNAFHGEGYDYFRHEALNANNPFLKAAGVPRPILQRNVFGATLGGPITKGRTLFFVSYEGTRETNGASILNSVSSDVLIAPGLTNDRSATALATLVGGDRVVNPIAAALLQARLPNGDFVIPAPQANDRYSGSAISRFREDQVNVTLDHHFSDRNNVSVRAFIANTPSTLALPTFRGSGPNVPGFGFDQQNNNRLIAVHDVHAFGTNVFNEARYVGFRPHASLRPELRVGCRGDDVC